MAVLLKLEPLSGGTLLGLDTKAHFLHLPVGQARSFKVVGGGTATAKLENPTLATLVFHLNGRGTDELLVELKGTGAGMTKLSLTIEGNQVLSWTVLVSDPIVIRIANHSVRGFRNQASVNDLTVLAGFTAANEILEPQANVRLESVSLSIPVVQVDAFRAKEVFHFSTRWNLLAAYRSSFQTRHIRQFADATADINAYFVGRISERGVFKRNDLDIAGFSVPQRKSIFIEDPETPANLGKILAHEVAHAMGAEHIPVQVNPRALMNPMVGGTELTRNDILCLRSVKH